jgi:hypothetical protein
MRRAFETLRRDANDRVLIALTLGLKAGILAIGFVAVALSVGGSAPSLLAPWDRWDAPHYTDIAVFGYMADDPGNLVGPAGYRQVYPGDLDLYIVFHPLFPWLAAAVRSVVGDPVVAAFVVAGVASLFVAPLLRRVVGIELGEAAGTRAALFMLLFPTAYFLHIGYTESLFLALVLGAFWLARTDRWWGAAVLAALATLTRVNGLVLLPALAVEAWTAWRTDPDRRLRPAWLAAIAGPVVGFGGYLTLNLAVYGNAMAWADIQRNHWHKSIHPPWDGIAATLGWFSDQDPDRVVMHGWLELGFIALGLAGTIYAAARFRPSWTAWMAGNWLLFTSTGFVLSAPRYSLVLFPLMAWFAVMAERRWVGTLIAAASTGMLGWFAWRFATGAWAF